MKLIYIEGMNMALNAEQIISVQLEVQDEDGKFMVLRIQTTNSYLTIPYTRGARELFDKLMNLAEIRVV